MMVSTLALATFGKWSLVFGGDLMLNQIQLKAKPLVAVTRFFSSGTVAFANLESPLTTSKRPTLRKSQSALKAKSQFLLRADPGFASQIASAGIGLVTLANNHCMDYGPSGLSQMTAALLKHKVAFAGAGPDLDEAAAVGTRTIRNGKVGLLSALAFVGDRALYACTPATDKTPGIHGLTFHGVVNRKAIRTWIANARKHCDFIVVGLHWGIERQSMPTPYQVELGRAFIDEGADVVWGCHPHVLEGAELYKGRPILYSMGNLVSPRPAQTALVKFFYQGSVLKSVKSVACLISGGRVTPLKKTSLLLAKLSLSLCKKYPSKFSRPLFRPNGQS
jgi:poly-gamma-glutamate capsule biosynthesis protein CapA/YwtB (metallophosphatase superfamily)